MKSYKVTFCLCGVIIFTSAWRPLYHRGIDLLDYSVITTYWAVHRPVYVFYKYKFQKNDLDCSIDLDLIRPNHSLKGNSHGEIPGIF